MRQKSESVEPARNRGFAVLAIVALLAMFAPGVPAEETPQAGKEDPRVRFVDYKPDDVVRLVGQFGYSTNITFSEGESVTFVGLGDTAAWEVAPATNHLFIKPKDVEATSNMTVLTDKGRTYTFSLATAPKAQKSKAEDIYYRVIFRYPAEVAKQAQQASSAETADKLLERPRRAIRNVDYLACGNAAVTPDQAFDDGRFTFLRYAGAREIPAVFVVAPDGSEALVDSHMEGDTLVVHRTAEKFVFRHGETVGCLVNKSYDPKGIPTFNGTVDAGVERVVKGTVQ